MFNSIWKPFINGPYFGHYHGTATILYTLINDNSLCHVLWTKKKKKETAVETRQFDLFICIDSVFCTLYGKFMASTNTTKTSWSKICMQIERQMRISNWFEIRTPRKLPWSCPMPQVARPNWVSNAKDAKQLYLYLQLRLHATPYLHLYIFGAASSELMFDFFAFLFRLKLKTL